VTDIQEPNPSPCLEMAHVLFMDIVAYSQLPMDEQTRLIGKLQQIVRGSTEFVRAQKRRQLLRLPTGDGMALVFFGNAEAPVRCAIEISRALRDNSELKLRMGVHTGPVQRVEDINANRNVAGGGINIAQRVMDCGDAGHILVSSTHAEVLGHISSWSAMLHDLGEAEVKHGVRVHVYNLYNEEAGNPELPKKISVQRAAPSEAATKVRKKNLLSIVIGGGATLALALVAGWLFYAHEAHALSATDTIVLADFTNKTGDAVFDDTLRQGLSVGLAQSPFFNLLSDQKIRDTLKLMGRAPDERLTPDIARDLCQRTGSKAYLSGSIASLGSQYVLGLNAVNCRTGDGLAQEQVTAEGKEHVLKALDEATIKLREKVGESLSTIQKFDVSILEATTPSLEALKAGSLASQALNKEGDFPKAITLYKRAIELDPNFAHAYASLAACYLNLGDSELAAQYEKKAYDLRDRVSEREKLGIEADYYREVTGNLQKAAEIYELRQQTYPREARAVGNLGILYGMMGQYDRALPAMKKSVELDPTSALSYANLASTYIALNHFDEARSTVEEARKRNLESFYLHVQEDQLAFLRSDADGMAQQVVWGMGKPGFEDYFLNVEADTAAYSGKLSKARELTSHATSSAERNQDKEGAAAHRANAALQEAFFGKPSEARKFATVALALSRARNVQPIAAFALAFAGDSVRAEALAADLGKRFAEDTLVNLNYLPAIHGVVQVNQGNPSRAVEILQAAAPFELGSLDTNLSLYPLFVRGEAFLAAHQGSAASAEFQKILDHRGIVFNEPIGVLAHLGLARAYALQGDSAKARAKYQDFLTLWKDADSDIPILKQAKAEYAKLQ
jgi:class 3 adenylate cyclase/Flp pilus assembly protein TadD